MHLRNKPVVWVGFCLVLAIASCSWAQGQQGSQGQQSQGQQQVQPTPLPSDVDPSDPALPTWMRPATPVTPPPGAKNTVPSNQTPGQGQAGQVTTGKNGSFTFKKDVEEVTLHATVVDQKQHLVTDLGQRNFVIYEDDQPQQITYFKREDIPVSIGILVDNSGSMRDKRAAVSRAVLNLVKSSNPQDEVFVVNFNDEPFLDQDFTNSLDLMHEALDRVDSRGGTALYDSVIASADHLAKGARREKKVLLVITDGEDNESRESLEQAIRSVQNDNGPTIYTIGILGSEGRERRAKRALEAMSVQTGGVAFFPKNLSEVDEISQAVARDIRNQYTITYKPSNPQANGGYRKIKVVASGSGYKDLQVRTRSGYFAGQQRASK
ncbi:MAG TPA: VWA domain-containing protein [Candidatus Angelobacter sp.]|nr:VWA domain-containing protein [Candidatus Angelobacter sp.]